HWRKSEAASDMESQMYTKPDAVEAYAKGRPKKPFILCEYSHAMGNSCGGLKEYTELFDRYPVLQGGFIWDWADQAIRTETPDGEPMLAYGGDFGESPHDGNFCGNGLVLADRAVTAKLLEAKACYQNADFSVRDWASRTFEVRNKHLFTDLAAFTLAWEIARSGVPEQQGEVEVHAAPGEAGAFTIPYAVPAAGATEDELVLTLRLVTKENAPWAPAGHEIA